LISLEEGESESETKRRWVTLCGSRRRSGRGIDLESQIEGEQGFVKPLWFRRHDWSSVCTTNKNRFLIEENRVYDLRSVHTNQSRELVHSNRRYGMCIVSTMYKFPEQFLVENVSTKPTTYIPSPTESETN
jgi:hypothetical protein